MSTSYQSALMIQSRKTSTSNTPVVVKTPTVQGTKKPSVSFNSTTTIVTMKDSNKEERKNPQYKIDYQNAISQGLSANDLAKRSASRADDKCDCKSCESSLHDHKKTGEKFGMKLYCGGALTMYRCGDCKKTICQLCYAEHKLKH